MSLSAVSPDQQRRQGFCGFCCMSGVHLLLPEAQRYYDTLRGLPHLTTLTPEALRKVWETDCPPIPAHLAPAKASHASAPGPVGAIPLRIYQPDGPGGFVGGNLETHAIRAAALCSLVQAVVVAVDYRLAPEHPHPAAMEDCWAATLWAASQAEHFNADASKLVVIGESAGGNLASVIPILAREQGKAELIKAQVSVCPVVDAFDTSTPSFKEFDKDEFEDAASIQWFFDRWFRQSGGDPKHHHISPTYAPSLASLPPAFILTAEVDVLRDGAEAYARKLSAAGVQVKCKRYKGHFHNSMIDIPVFGKAAEDVYLEIKEFLADVLSLQRA